MDISPGFLPAALPGVRLESYTKLSLEKVYGPARATAYPDAVVTFNATRHKRRPRTLERDPLPARRSRALAPQTNQQTAVHPTSHKNLFHYPQQLTYSELGRP